MMARHGVEFIVVGGWAIEVQVAAEGKEIPYPPTRDIDIAPQQELGNLARLADALTDLEADIRTEVGRFQLHHVAEDFVGTGIRNLTCDIGDFDLTFQPAEMGTYDDMLPSAVEMWVPVEGESDPVRVMCADLTTIYRSKASLDRDKDRRALDFLEHHLHRRRRPTPQSNRNTPPQPSPRPPITRHPQTHQPLRPIRLHQPHPATTTPRPAPALPKRHPSNRRSHEPRV